MATLWNGSADQTNRTPGSIQARQNGCTCDPSINTQGRGLMTGEKDLSGRPLFLVTSGCGLHATTDVGHKGNTNTSRTGVTMG